MKDVLDVASFGSSEGSSYAASVLEEFESFRHELPITLKQQSSIHQSTNDNRRSNLPIFISRQITVDRWETYMSSLSIRNIPIYGPITESISESDLPVHKFKVDLEIWVTYLPASSELNEVVPSSTKFPSRSDLNPRLCSHSKGNPYLIEFLRRLPILESLSVCYLRHQFLQAWKTTINTVPHACFDVYPMTLPSTRNGAGALLFVDFVDWIQTFLSSQMLLKIPPFSVSPKVICDDKVAST